MIPPGAVTPGRSGIELAGRSRVRRRRRRGRGAARAALTSGSRRSISAGRHVRRIADDAWYVPAAPRRKSAALASTQRTRSPTPFERRVVARRASPRPPSRSTAVHSRSVRRAASETPITPEPQQRSRTASARRVPPPSQGERREKRFDRLDEEFRFRARDEYAAAHVGRGAT